jgi:hypothetical protein
MNTPKQLSDSLLAACKAAGIENPRYIAQDKNGDVWHYLVKPYRISFAWVFGGNEDDTIIVHPPYADHWQDSLLEWVEPQNVESTLVSLPKEEEVAKIWDGFVNATITELSQESIPWDTAYKISKPQGEPPANVLARHPDHVADDSKMIDNSEFATAVNQILGGIGEMLIAKNKAYGNSALDPIRVFAKSDTKEQLNVRIDDKLSRIMRGTESGEDVDLDLIGYLVIRRIAMAEKGVGKL